jgi:hypothetical protein
LEQHRASKPGIHADIIDVSTAKEGGKAYAVYTILVKVTDDRGCEEVKHVFRR